MRHLIVLAWLVDKRGQRLNLQQTLTLTTLPHFSPVLVVQTASAVAYVHAMGLVHRDIKPHNIFLSASQPVVAKLGDFGLTSASGAGSGSTAHTPRYAPPEVLHDGAVGGPSGDVYSFAVVTWEVLTLDRCVMPMDRTRGKPPVRPVRAAIPGADRSSGGSWDEAATDALVRLWKECFAEAEARPLMTDLADMFDALATLTDADANAGSLFVAAVASGHVSVLHRLDRESMFVPTALVDGIHTKLSLAATRGRHEMLAWLVDNSGSSIDTPDAEGMRPLMRAVDRGHSECVRLLLDSSADPNAYEIAGLYPRQTALFRAAAHDYAEIARDLIASGAAVNVAANFNRTPLHYAAQEGSVQAMDVLLSSGALPNTHVDQIGKTALHLAAKAGALACVRLLLVAGADPTAATVEGHQPVHDAAYFDVVDVLQALVEHTGDVDAVNAQSGQTPLMEACDQGNPRAAERLLELGADIHARDNAGLTAIIIAARAGHVGLLPLLLGAGANPNEVWYEQTKSVLVVAIEAGLLEAVALLVEAGADLAWRAPGGRNYLMVAAGSVSIDVVRFFLDAGLDATFTDDHGMTALAIAAQNALLGAEVVDLLIDAGAALCPAAPAESPLIAACAAGAVDFVRVMCARGVDPNIRSVLREHNDPALVLGAASTSAEVVDILIGHGANVNAASAAGETALMAAASCQSVVAVLSLLAAAADVNAETADGNTALTVAAKRGPLACVEALVAAGAHVGHRNAAGEDALMTAVLSRRPPELVSLLVSCGGDLDAVNPFIGTTVRQEMERIEATADASAADMRSDSSSRSSDTCDDGEVIADRCMVLFEAGFVDVEANMAALIASNGSLRKAQKLLSAAQGTAMWG